MPSMVDDLRSKDAVLTTHVLDMARGQPGRGLQLELFRLTEGAPEKILSTATNADGRCDAPLLSGDAFSAGQYELVFHAGDYLRQSGVALPDPAFLDVIPIRFGIADAGAHYHVPLLISPYGYSTYRVS